MSSSLTYLDLNRITHSDVLFVNKGCTYTYVVRILLNHFRHARTVFKVTDEESRAALEKQFDDVVNDDNDDVDTVCIFDTRDLVGCVDLITRSRTRHRFLSIVLHSDDLPEGLAQDKDFFFVTPAEYGFYRPSDLKTVVKYCCQHLDPWSEEILDSFGQSRMSTSPFNTLVFRGVDEQYVLAITMFEQFDMNDIVKDSAATGVSIAGLGADNRLVARDLVDAFRSAIASAGAAEGAADVDMFLVTNNDVDANKDTLGFAPDEIVRPDALAAEFTARMSKRGMRTSETLEHIKNLKYHATHANDCGPDKDTVSIQCRRELDQMKRELGKRMVVVFDDKDAYNSSKRIAGFDLNVLSVVIGGRVRGAQYTFMRADDDQTMLNFHGDGLVYVVTNRKRFGGYMGYLIQS